MTLLEQFIKISAEKGTDLINALIEKNEKFDTITFDKKAEKDKNLIYNIILTFYDNENIAEICIRKKVNIENKLNVYEKLNLYNSLYRRMTFFIDDDMICEKSYCSTNNKMSIIIMLKNNFDIVQELFSVFEPA